MKKEHNEWLKNIVLPNEMHQDFIDYLESLDVSDDVKKQGVVSGEIDYQIYKPGEPIKFSKHNWKVPLFARIATWHKTSMD